jgi:site-specific recombinase XerD
VSASKAANTLRAYKSDMRQVCKYLADTGNTEMVSKVGDNWQLIKPMPAALIAPIWWNAQRQGTALTSLQRHVASISKWHEVAANNNPGMTNPCKTQLVRDTLGRLRKQNKRQPCEGAATNG